MYQKKQKLSARILPFIFTLACAAPCFAQNSDDPLEHFNRSAFILNDKLDTYILKPIATFYNKVMPKPLNLGVHNFFNNINTIPTIANDILQLNLYQTLNDTWRLAINTTVGIGGLFDIATRMNLPFYANDFGLTLAKYGYKNSTYIVWPFFGPSTIRDGVAMPVDYFAFSVYPRVHPWQTRYELYGLSVVDRRAQLLKIQSVMEEAAIDRYAFVRNAYLQRRSYQIKDNQNRGPGQTPESYVEDGETVAPAPIPEIGAIPVLDQDVSSENAALGDESSVLDQESKPISENTKEVPDSGNKPENNSNMEDPSTKS